MLKPLLAALSALTATTLANPFPVPEPAAALVGEDIPWQIYNLSIFSFPTNTTKLNRTQHIRFDAVDINPDLEFDTTCERWAAAGQPFFGDGYTACEFEMAGFSIRPDGMLWLRRKYTNSEPWPYNVTTCTGYFDLKGAKYYSNGPEGMTVVDDHLEIPCTLQSGGGGRGRPKTMPL